LQDTTKTEQDNNKRGEKIMKELYTQQIRVYRRIQKKLERACSKDECRRDPHKDFKVSTEGEKKFWKTFETVKDSVM
jgi:hypothetical protein